MTDAEILRKFVRTVPLDEGVAVEVARISWEGHTPSTTWERVVVSVDAPAAAALAKRLSANRRYFQRCRTCGELNPTGWMFRPTMCQSCAERTLGIVF